MNSSILSTILLVCLSVFQVQAAELTETSLVLNVEGHASLAPDMFIPQNWQANSRVLLNYGKYIGFIKEDGGFVVEGVAPGSYVLEVTNVDYIFEPIRVDITSKGKIRARKLNVLQVRFFRQNQILQSPFFSRMPFTLCPIR